jgi:hypothetical protein
MRPYLKNTHHKKGLVEWLKVKALSSNPSTSRKKKEIKKKLKIPARVFRSSVYVKALSVSPLLFSLVLKSCDLLNPSLPFIL